MLLCLGLGVWKMEGRKGASRVQTGRELPRVGSRAGTELEAKFGSMVPRPHINAGLRGRPEAELQEKLKFMMPN